MPSPSELDAAKQMLNAHRGNRVLAVTITYDEWKRGTELGLLKTRSSEFEAIDAALRDYHNQSKSEAAFVRLRQAFDNWIRAQQRAGKAWTQSERNRTGLVAKLHEQIVLVDGGRSVKQMGDTKDWDARMAMLTAEREALATLFAGRKLVFKSEVKSAVKHVVEQYTTMVTAGRAASNISKGASGAITSQDVAGAFSKVGGALPDHLASAFGVTAAQLCGAFANVLNFGAAPVKLLANLVDLGLGTKARVQAGSSRPAFAPGNADAALDAIIRMINQELLLIGKDIAKNTGSIVATAFSAGPIASAANAVVDVIVNNALYVQMLREIDRGNAQLAMGRLSLDLFTASPVLGCYFILMADTNIWVNFSVHDIGTDGWMRQVETLVRRAEPVRDKAREYIRVSRYALSGTEGFKGLEWEPSWRNNKLAYLKQKLDGGGLGGAGIATARVLG